MTTNVDFTNFAQVGVEEGFEVLSYAPMAEMERAFFEKAPRGIKMGGRCVKCWRFDSPTDPGKAVACFEPDCSH